MSTRDTLYAEDMNYFKTSKSSPDTWMKRIRNELEAIGGKILLESFASDASGRAAYLLRFEIEGVVYRVAWPVLGSKKGDTLAARRQAVTSLYHDIKQKCISVKLLGAKRAFTSFIMLPNGISIGEMTAQDDLREVLPEIYQAALSGSGPHALTGPTLEKSKNMALKESGVHLSN